MNIQSVSTLSDERLSPYQNLRDRTLRGEQLFIAEGDLVVERLLNSRYKTESLLVSDRAFERVLPLLERKVPQETPIFVVPFETLEPLLGFPFHQGVLAIGKREEIWTLEDLLPIQNPAKQRNSARRVLAVLPDVTKPDNVGVVFRNCAALGVDGVLLGPQACDPLSRRGLRVSMGGVFQLPWLKTDDLNRDLERIRNDFHYVCYGTVLAADAIELKTVKWENRLAICFGNEYDGLKPETLAHCDVRMTIPMACGVDSLNLGVSSGIFLYDACFSNKENLSPLFPKEIL